MSQYPVEGKRSQNSSHISIFSEWGYKNVYKPIIVKEKKKNLKGKYSYNLSYSFAYHLPIILTNLLLNLIVGYLS